MGIFVMMDEESKLASGSDKSLVSKLHQKFKTNKYFDVPKTDPNSFIINHYAEPVNYLINDFRIKNQNTIEEDILLFFKNSQLQPMQIIFKDVNTSNQVRKTKPPTISSIFKVKTNFFLLFFIF